MEDRRNDSILFFALAAAASLGFVISVIWRVLRVVGRILTVTKLALENLAGERIWSGDDGIRTVERYRDTQHPVFSQAEIQQCLKGSHDSKGEEERIRNELDCIEEWKIGVAASSGFAPSAQVEAKMAELFDAISSCQHFQAFADGMIEANIEVLACRKSISEARQCVEEWRCSEQATFGTLRVAWLASWKEWLALPPSQRSETPRGVGVHAGLSQTVPTDFVQ